ncbi:MAG: hypothetical protein ABWW70_04870 [Thermoproteota archaeon]
MRWRYPRLHAFAEAYAGITVTFLLTLATLYLTYTSVSLLVTVGKLGAEEGQREVTMLRVVGLNVDRKNGVLEIYVRNEGPHTLTDVAELDVVVSYQADVNGSLVPVTFILRYSPGSPQPGEWAVREIQVDGISYAYIEHPYLKPGETAVIEAVVPLSMPKGSYGTVTVVAPSGDRAEYAFVAR